MITYFENNSVPILFTVGVMFLIPLAFSQLTKRLGLPNIIAYMVAGIILGPSVLNFLDEQTLGNMEFITHMVLGFVAFKIGLEVNIREILAHGRGIIITVLSESFLAAIMVSLFLYLFTGNLALALIFGALAPASAPAGTIAVIDETKSKGSLTQTLYSIVGIDDGLAIIIFGFIIPLFYLLFFTLAGANLHLESVPALGLIGLLYVTGRIVGKGSGAFIGASIGKMESKIRNYLGFGILSQAGVAIGLALVVKNRFQGLGPEINDAGLTMGDHIGNMVFTTITATSVIFEIIGPILAKYALKKSGEAQV